MNICYVKYLDLNAQGDCNKIVFFSGFMDAYEFRNDILALKDKYGDDIMFDGEVGMIEYFNKRELIQELNKISAEYITTNPEHIK